MSERPVRLIELDDDARTTIQDMLQQRQLTPRVRERLKMVKAAAPGHDLPTIGAWSGRSVETVRRWLARFADAGIAEPRLAVRCLDLGAVKRLSPGTHHGCGVAGLDSRAAGAATVCVWAAQTHPRPSPGRR